MAVDRSTYQIEIKTTADLAGAKATLAILEGQKQALEQMGKATTEVDSKIEAFRHNINNAQIFGGIEDSAKGATKETGEFLEGHHGIHAISHGLNEALPGVMQFSRFLTSGFAAAIGAVVLVFGYLQDKLEDFKKLVEDLNTGPGARGEWAEKIRDNVREASVEAATFNQHLDNLVTAQERLTRSTDIALAAIRTQFADAGTLAEQQKQLDIARLALREQLGEATPEQAVQIRLEIDDAAFRRELETKKAEIQAELSVRNQQLTANNNREPALNAARERSEAAALAAKNAQDTNDAKLAQDRENLARAQESLDKSEERLLQPHHFGDRGDTFIRRAISSG